MDKSAQTSDDRKNDYPLIRKAIEDAVNEFNKICVEHGVLAKAYPPEDIQITPIERLHK